MEENVRALVRDGGKARGRKDKVMENKKKGKKCKNMEQM